MIVGRRATTHLCPSSVGQSISSFGTVPPLQHTTPGWTGVETGYSLVSLTYPRAAVEVTEYRYLTDYLCLRYQCQTRLPEVLIECFPNWAPRLLT